MPYLSKATARWSKQQSTSRPWPFLLYSESPLSRRDNLLIEASPWHQRGTVPLHTFTGWFCQSWPLSLQHMLQCRSVWVYVSRWIVRTLMAIVLYISGYARSNAAGARLNKARVAAGARGPRDNSRRRRDARRRRCRLLLSVILPPSFLQRTDAAGTVQRILVKGRTYNNYSLLL